MKRTNVKITGPLAPYLPRILNFLSLKSYSPLSAVNLVRLTSHFSGWLERRRISPEMLTYEQIDAYFQYRRRIGRTGFISRRALSPILECLSEEGIIKLTEQQQRQRKAPLEELLDDYSEYLIKERSIGENSRKFRLKVGRELLTLKCERMRKPSSISAKNLSEFILAKFKRFSVSSCQVYVTALRCIVRYLFIRGEISVDISSAVPAVARWRMKSLPKALSRNEIDRLLLSCDRRTHDGRLSYAVLLLMIRLGLRAGEAGALKLKDIHWRQGQILIYGKGGYEDLLPLPEDVGIALADYLRKSRKKTEIRSVFLSKRAPLHALGSAGVKRVVTAACKKAGIAPGGSHRLRHTAATEMLQQGVPLPEIAQVLRHRSISTTSIYAKVDRTSLRTLAQLWLGEV